LSTILIVEDDNGAREALGVILGAAGYSVLSAENGKHALESVTATQNAPTLILLDLVMPVMDGLAFLARIPEYAQLASVPVIVMSGDSQARQLSQFHGNVMAVLAKPLNLSSMMELVRQYTEQPAHRSQ